MKKLLLLYFLPFFFTACSAPGDPPSDSLVNTAHLEHLYEADTIGDTRLGAIWIYSEAPDYRLVADADEGFTCVDDVARALVFYCRRYPSNPPPEVLDKIRTLTEFLLYMQADNGFFYNFLLPGPKVNKTHRNSEAVAGWWSWRAFWALSEVNLVAADGLADLHSRNRTVLDTLVVKMQALCPAEGEPIAFDGLPVPACLADLGADQVGVIMIGLANYYRVNPSEAIKRLLLSFGEQLLDTQQGDAQNWPYYAFPSWRNYWHAWGNSQAYALLYSGRTLRHEPFIQAGLNEVRYFYPYCLEEGFLNGFKVVKEADSLLMQEYQQFPQIAYAIRPMAFASLEAFSITGDTTYAVTAGRLASWLFGNNPAEQEMYDPLSGRTFDGINSPTDVNHNSGAESTIEALLCLQAVEAVPEAWKVVKAFLEEREKAPQLTNPQH